MHIHLFRHPRGNFGLDHVQLGDGPARRDARPQARDRIVIEIALNLFQIVFRVAEGFEDVRLVCHARELEAGRQHAGHQGGAAVQNDLPADDGGIAVEAPLPQRSGNDDYMVAPFGLFFHEEAAAALRVDSQNLEGIRRYPRADKPLRFAGAGQVHRRLDHDGDRLQGGAALAPLQIVIQVDRQAGV